MQTIFQPQHREFAAIDLGSNSFHLIIARINNGAIQILSRIKRRVRLADGLNEHNQLSQEAIARGVACLKLFADRLQGFSAENVRVVGTYTLRQAVNNGDFLQQAAAVFPYPINIIKGEEEARLIYAGVSHTQPEKGRKLVVDIGGGSTEMTIGDDFTPLRAESRSMGCVSFAKHFFPKGQLNKSLFDAAYRDACDKIADLRVDYQTLGWQNVLGSSGTIKTVHKVLLVNGYHDGLITEARLQKLIERSLQFSSLQNIKIKGLLEERADVFVPGLAILLALFHTFNIQSMRYSDGALREGVMYGLESAFQVEDIRARTAQGLICQFDIDRQQGQRVSRTALQLFAQISGWKNPSQRQELETLLHWCCQLHEIGIAINHQNLHKHSAYLINHCELPGFDFEQRQLLATLMRYHLKTFKHHDIRSSNRYQRRDILTLLRLFRLAVILNRARQASPIPQGLRLSQSNQGWHLHFAPRFLHDNPLINADLKEEQQLLRALGLGLQLEEEKGEK